MTGSSRRVSKKHSTNLQIRYEGGKGTVAVFYLDAIVDATHRNLRLELNAIENGAKALKEAYQSAT
jgi:hypothetical protein